MAEVVSIDERDIAGNLQKFYVLRILDTDRKIMVPVSNADAVGLRQVISEQEIREIFDILQERTIGFAATHFWMYGCSKTIGSLECPLRQLAMW